MRLPIIAISLVVLARSAPVLAQCGKASSESTPDAQTIPCRVDSIFSAAEAPAVFSDIKIRSTDLLEASLSVEDKGGSLTYAPLLYTLRDYQPLVSELRLRLNQKDSLTTLGVGIQYNPLSPRSARGKREWLKPGGSAPPPQRLQMLLTQRKQAKEKALADLRIKFAEAAKAPTDQADLPAKQAQQQKLADEILAVEQTLAPINAELAALAAADTKRTAARIQDFYRRLFQTPLPVVGVAYNATLFTTLAGSFVDANNNGLNDVAHRLKKHTFSLSVDSRLSDRVQLSGLVVREWVRGSAEEGIDFAHTTGLSFSAGSIVAILDDRYQDSDAYRTSLFIPSVVLGGAIEFRHCGNASAKGVICPDRLERLTALTPFVDLKVTPTLQFRIGAPVRLSKPVVGKSGTDLGVVSALTLQLGQPK